MIYEMRWESNMSILDWFQQLSTFGLPPLFYEDTALIPGDKVIFNGEVLTHVIRMTTDQEDDRVDAVLRAHPISPNEGGGAFGYVCRVSGWTPATTREGELAVERLLERPLAVQRGTVKECGA